MDKYLDGKNFVEIDLNQKEKQNYNKNRNIKTNIIHLGGLSG